MLERAAHALLALAVVACAHPEPPPPSSSHVEQRARERELSRLQVAQRARRLELLLGNEDIETARAAPFRIVGADDGPVPDFELTTPDGWRYSSKSLVGQQPFVLVFFATWCDYCRGELEALTRALGEVKPMLVIPVSADDTGTWAQVPSYLAAYGIRQPAVRAKDYPLFSVAYDPFDTVPVVAIVGRNGGLVDYHVGYDPAYAQRLVASLRLAHQLGPLARPLGEQARGESQSEATSRNGELFPK